MKFRLLEYLTCPDHPDEFLQLRTGHIAKLFDHESDVSSPACQAYCGLAQGKFEDIPEYVIPDCKECMGLEIEWGTLRCPECGGFYSMYDGIPVLSKFFKEGTLPDYEKLAVQFDFGKSRYAEFKRTGPVGAWADRREANLLKENIDLEAVESALFLGCASLEVLDLFCGVGVEMIHAGDDPHELLRLRERDILCPRRFAYFTVPSGDLKGFRSESFDLVLTSYRLYGPKKNEWPKLDQLARLLRRSGSVAIILYRDSLTKRFLHLNEGEVGKYNGDKISTNEFLEMLPDSLKGLEREEVVTSLFDLVKFRFNIKTPGEIRVSYPGDEAEALINA